MKPSEGYEQMDAVAGGEVTSVAGNGEAQVPGSAGHPVLSTEAVTNYFGHLSGDL